jgi:diguanylate cyclase (GGDEF)-like protein
LWAVIGASASALLLAAPPTWSIGYALIDAVSVIGPLVLLAAGVAAALHGDRPARWYLVAMVILLAGISAASAAALVFAEPPSWTESAPRLGAILMVVLFSLGLSDKYHQSLRAQERMRAENETLQAFSFRDGMTGLANRRAFDDRFATEWQRAARDRHPISLVVIDVDHFKQYNDRYGHQADDDCLRRVAGALAECLRRPGDLAARYGGEEFVGLTAGSDRAGAAKVAEAIRAAVERLQMPHEGSATAAVVTISAGVASTDGGAFTGTAALFAAADAALYAAKRTGRNRVEVASSAAP